MKKTQTGPDETGTRLKRWDAGNRVGRGAALAGCLGLMALGFPGAAHAFDWSLKLEPGLATPVTSPQTEKFNLGGAVTLKALFGLGPYVDIGPTVGFLGLPPSGANPSSDTGVAWQVGAGLRLKRPHDEGKGMGAVSPWLDTDVMYVRSGPLDLFGFAVGAGLAFPIGEERRYWLGPFVRYLQVVQPEREGFDRSDARIVIVGLSLELGSKHEPPVAEKPIVYQCPPTGVCPVIVQLSDRDSDGLTDAYDRCPDVAGPIDNQGCPRYAKITVKQDKLVLNEHIQFPWDQSTIEPESYPMLDEVVVALKENKSFDVRIEGHASSEGQYDHNQTLSEKRAESVKDYLVSHGVAKERLQFKGFGSSVPIQPNETVKGREANRRVVFEVELIILNKRSAQ
ncbi:MAG: OmpA family protein [Myxococcota bacterium]